LLRAALAGWPREWLSDAGQRKERKGQHKGEN